jgi:hypothetical protein
VRGRGRPAGSGPSLDHRDRAGEEARVVGVEQWAEIRRLHRVERLSIREISRRLGVHRKTVRRALVATEPPKVRAQASQAPRSGRDFAVHPDRSTSGVVRTLACPGSDSSFQVAAHWRARASASARWSGGGCPWDTCGKLRRPSSGCPYAQRAACGCVPARRAPGFSTVSWRRGGASGSIGVRDKARRCG